MNYKRFVESESTVKLSCKSCPTGFGSNCFIFFNKKIFLDFLKKQTPTPLPPPKKDTYLSNIASIVFLYECLSE